MRAFLTEWLIRHGTEWVNVPDLLDWNELAHVGAAERLKYARAGYLQYPGITADRYKLTPEGLEYLRNDTK